MVFTRLIEWSSGEETCHYEEEPNDNYIFFLPLLANNTFNEYLERDSFLSYNCEVLSQNINYDNTMQLDIVSTKDLIELQNNSAENNAMNKLIYNRLSIFGKLKNSFGHGGFTISEVRNNWVNAKSRRAHSETNWILEKL